VQRARRRTRLAYVAAGLCIVGGVAVLGVLGRSDVPSTSPWCEHLYARARSAEESTAVDRALALPNPNKQAYANPSYCRAYRLAKLRAAKGSQ
jgi:hypothetical protein